MRPRKLEDAGREEIRQVALCRAALPTDKELAKKWKISVNWVKGLVSQAKKELVPESVETRFHEKAKLNRLVEKVQANHMDRLDPPMAEKLVPRPFQPRARPKTALIARAAQEAIATRELEVGDSIAHDRTSD